MISKIRKAIVLSPIISMALTASVAAQNLTNATTDITQIPIAFSRVVNLLVGGASAVFIVMIFMMAIKFATSVDDPRGLDAAKQTGTMAVVGLVVTLGFWMIIRGIATAFGIDAAVFDPTQAITDALQDLVNWGESAGNAIPGMSGFSP